jgi:putative endonuclease
MFNAYVIKSIRTTFLYKGHCENLQERLKQHNAGQTQSTRPHLPFEIIHFEEFPTRAEAIKREKYFKSAAGRRFLKSKMDDKAP